MEANGCSGHSIWVPADCRALGAWARSLSLPLCRGQGCPRPWVVPAFLQSLGYFTRSLATRGPGPWRRSR